LHTKEALLHKIDPVAKVEEHTLAVQRPVAGGEVFFLGETRSSLAASGMLHWLSLE
jgi:hypothetical protein